MEKQRNKILYTYKFDFGDGNTETFENKKCSSYPVEHTYANKGNYTVSINATADTLH